MRHLPIPIFSLALGVTLLASSFAQPASAEATLVVEADSGRVLHAEHATYPWYPASTTKLMTMYLTLKAVKDGRLGMDTLLTVSPNAVAQAPSKMGFAAGTQVTVDNALKMIMVKSANDMSVVLAEGVSGSIEKFADDMNAASRRLGMTQSSWVNPNGLPADEQITSARDMAILARAILRELPEYEMYWHIPSIRFGRRVMRNTNSLIGRYPDADGMKTGFICASGFNVVATATRGGRKLIVVVFGSRSGMVRSEKAAQLFERGFSAGGISWLMPSFGTVEGTAAGRRRAAEFARRDVRTASQAPREGRRRFRNRSGAEQQHRPELGLCGNAAEPAGRRGDWPSARPAAGVRTDPGVDRPAPGLAAGDASRRRTRQEEARHGGGADRPGGETGRKAGRDRGSETCGKAGNGERVGRRFQPDAIDQAAKRQHVHARFRRNQAGRGARIGRQEWRCEAKNRREA